ncbi:glycosyltransferase family 2 protein [Aureispira anguillae]|uniref:Glycosyltransferase family 2 protein n=1 Tax=Aureispira anguillae TaxID=2864201 RepID=A0A915YKC2_9BACT|nr:glycosyltransferase family 2 protein [Aureispira anguillae]BDS14670.1 glycosyltransferase family 2 protein [Aureispira anguillae]
MKKVDISIVIVNFNTFDLTCACIDSIYLSQTRYSYEIILVDNASTDRKATDFCEKYPDLVLVTSAKNCGFGRANNMGMERAKGAYIWLINSDTEVSEKVLEKGMATLQEHQADLYSCAQTLADGSPLFYKKKSFYLGLSLKAVWYSLPLFHLSYFNRKFIDQSTVNEVIEANTVSGAFMLFRREVFEKTKGFDPDFFLYSEETEWCYNRIRKQFKIIYDPFNSFIHKQGSSSNQDMSVQGYISNSLGYYKRGYGIYLIYLLMQYLIALPMNIGFYLISKKEYKKAYSDQIKLLISGWRYLMVDIPRFSNKFGARKRFLVIRQLDV